MKNTLKITMFFFFVLISEKILTKPLMDSMILHSVEQCAERLFMYHKPYLWHGDSSKPIYWAKIISLDKELKKWEIMYFETNRKGLFTIGNFTEGIIVNRNEYLLLFEYDTLPT
jgi:hypothetical protein